ncbi:hypothetical protein [Streptomyces sp. H51]|uniref:hypothetical protein n=1 Tax=Streptomyces sp. H51 TaxID=3111770 RepID=UPI002D78FD15|nr:hypothetical protein [Streptomyces sp. H51]
MVEPADLGLRVADALLRHEQPGDPVRSGPPGAPDSTSARRPAGPLPHVLVQRLGDVPALRLDDLPDVGTGRTDRQGRLDAQFVARRARPLHRPREPGPQFGAPRLGQRVQHVPRLVHALLYDRPVPLQPGRRGAHLPDAEWRGPRSRSAGSP